jgi:hypothetical protein
MMRKRITPEERALWAEARAELERQIAKIDARRRERAEAEERRVRRLRRLTFGLLPR